jgi:iduronate 2-sulfatase
MKTGYSLLIAVTLIPQLSIGSEAPSARQRLNVLFIAVDDLRPELGCYGTEAVLTPHIDRLARHSVTFTRAYCQQAVCNPSRASLMTGLRPDTLRVWDLYTDFRETTPDAITIPQHFMRHGYYAGAVGKIYHNNIPDPPSWSEEKLHIDGYPFDPDAVYVTDENLAWLERRKAELIAAGTHERRIDRYGQWYLKASATESADCPDSAYYDGAQTDVAIEKLAELKSRDEPFFFAVGYYRPHLPFNAPKKYWDLYERSEIPLAENPQRPEGAPLMATNTMRELIAGYNDFHEAPRPDEGSLTEDQARLLKHGYYASVSYVDAQIGRLLDEVQRLDLWEETIVVLWGDHGWKLGEHNSWCKMTNYEIDARVPLIVRKPNGAENGNQCDRLVEFVDIYPSLCDVAGLPIPDGLEGLSFGPLLENRRLPWKQAAFTQFLREGKWVAPDGIVYMGRTIRTDRYRYVRWSNHETGELAAEELYDHQSDPCETVNVAGQPDFETLIAGLRERLASGWGTALPVTPQ